MKKFYSLAMGLGSFLSVAQNSCALAPNISAGNHVITAVNGTQSVYSFCLAQGSMTAAEWYSYTPATNCTVTVSTDLPGNPSNINTRVQVYSGECSNMNCVAADDDAGTTHDLASVVQFTGLANVNYFIVFDNRWSSAGFTFSITETAYVPQYFEFSSFPVTLTGTMKGCIVDMNGDYLDDVVGTSPNSVNILYQQTNGAFNSVTIPTPIADFPATWSIAAGDLDRNGKTDLVYGNGSGVTFMKQNAAGTGFTEWSPQNYVFSQRSNMIDINNDGHLDAFMCHDVEANMYYINDGNGNFSVQQGGLGNIGGNYGSIWVDYDNDGDSDLFIAKCGGGGGGNNIDELHRNNGNGTFTNVSVAANMNEPSQSWSSAWADFDNDGDMDAMIGATSFGEGGHKLRRNNGDGTFTEISAGSGWDTFTPTSMTHVAHDFDNDGWVDVLTGGNRIMRNNGNMTFTPISISPITTGPVGDLNNDGFLDIQNNNVLFLNNGNSNHWIKILLQGVQSNRNGIGARVEIYGSWGKQIRDVRSGDGFNFMSSLNTHFGIGSATAIAQVVIRWPSGTVDVVENPSPDTSLFVLEGSSPLAVSDATKQSFVLYPNPANDFLNISHDDSIRLTSVQFFDVLGRTVLSETEQYRIPISTLTSGTYTAILTDDQGRKHTQKFIKK